MGYRKKGNGKRAGVPDVTIKEMVGRNSPLARELKIWLRQTALDISVAELVEDKNLPPNVQRELVGTAFAYQRLNHQGAA